MDNALAIFFSYFWVWLPLTFVAAGSFKEWLAMKEKTALLGTSTESMEQAILDLHKERVDLIKRIQNLEAIVAHETPEAPRAAMEPARIDASLLAETQSDADRVARKVDRLGL